MRKIYILGSIILLLIIIFVIYTKLSYLTIIVKFNDLEPFEKQMNVYYKGFKIGKTTKIYPDKDYLNTYLKLKIKPRNIKLPNNIYAVIKNTPTKQYVNIIYPDAPSLSRIKSGTTINGKVSKDLKSIFNDSLDENNIDAIVDDATSLIDSANNAVQNLNIIFNNINRIIINIQPDIEAAAGHINKTTSNLENITSNLNNALTKDLTRNSAVNIEKTTENIKEITSDLSNITDAIENETMPVLNSIMCETNSTMQNTEEITSGIKTTLKKRMGLMKLMLGRPINNNCD